MTDLNSIRISATPALVVIRETLERNLEVMQARCIASGVSLRAHGKMHKCSTLAKMQIAKGAIGICAQTLGEAEAFAANGVSDLLVTSPPSLRDAKRLVQLAHGTRVRAVTDDTLLIAAVASAAREAGSEVNLLVDIDLGQHRTGIPSSEVVALAKIIASTSGVRFAGIQGYLGHLQHIPKASDRIAANAAALARLSDVVRQLEQADLAPGIVTGGGTGTHTGDLAAGVFTEIQAGSYALMDAEYGACESPSGEVWPFAPALFLASTVISARHRTHVTVDAGLKALSSDGPAARVVAGAAGGSLWRRMGDEHGAIIHPGAIQVFNSDAVDPLALQRAIDQADVSLPLFSNAPRLGDTVWMQPGHCDPTINLHEAFLVLQPDGSWNRWPIDARRKVPDPSDTQEL